MSDGMTRLRSLLLDSEQARLADLQRRLELVAEAERLNRNDLAERIRRIAEVGEREFNAVHEQIAALVQRAGSDESFRASVAAVLDGAIRDAELSRHKELSRAMGPLVVGTIRTQLQQNENEILQALYPHTGRMVRDFMADAMRDLYEQINRKLEAGLRQNALMLRIRSLTTGRPVAELALAEMARPEVTDLFLIKRGTGELIQRWPATDTLSNTDVHLSGVLSSINDFAQNAFKDDGGMVRSFEMDKSTIFLRASPVYLLAAKVSGPELPGSQTLVDETFIEIMEANRQLLAPAHDEPRPAASAEAKPVLETLAHGLEQRISARHSEIAVPTGLGFNPLLVLAFMIGLPLLAWIGWSAYVDYETARIRGVANEIVAAETDARLLRPELEVGRLGSTIRINALAPSEAARDKVVGQLRAALPRSVIEDRIAVLPNAALELEPRIDTVRRNVAALELDMLRASITRTVERCQRRMSSALADIESLIANAGTEQQRRLARQVKLTTEQAAADIGAYSDIAGQAQGDAGAFTRLAAPLHAARLRLDAAGNELSGFLSKTAAVKTARPADTVVSNDPLRSAEELAAAAERLAAMTLAVLQASQVKPEERPAPPPVIVQPPAPSPRAVLVAWTQSNAIFFDANTGFRSPPQAETALDELATLIKAADTLVRVVGFTDDRGNPALNFPLSQARADKVAADLIARGVPATRLVAIGRKAQGLDISPSQGNGSPNRRVEFEVGFIGEAQ